MKRYQVMVLLAGAVAVAVMLGGTADALASPAPAAGAWGKATKVPGLSALNADGRAQVSAVSCGPAGGCAAGGAYENSHGHLQGFVVSEQNGTWGEAIGVPGLAALNADGQAEVLTVSCGPAGGCAAGGYYYDPHGQQQGFVVSEQNGTWGKASEGSRPLGRLRGRRLLLRPAWSAAGVRGQRAERYLGQGDRGTWPLGPERGVRRGLVGVVRPGRRWRGRGLLLRPAWSAGIRGQRAERDLGQGDRSTQPGGPERGRA